MAHICRMFVAGALVCGFVSAANAQFQQQGILLFGSGGSGSQSLALSADGTTALVGEPTDNGVAGGVLVFVSSAGVWSQQDKLLGSGAVGNSQQGWAVALSADGNTALVGGPADSQSVGAVWVFTRSGSAWTQQGGKLTASDAIGQAHQGMSVGLSADGNTAILGGQGDDRDTGAAWVFTRSGGVWSLAFARCCVAVARSTTLNAVLTLSALAPAGGLTIQLASDNTGVAPVPATITLPATATSVNVPIAGIAAGSTTVHASAPNLPSTSIRVTVQ
jgi:hypothetical protein